jgi:predicted transcriptional regulator
VMRESVTTVEPTAMLEEIDSALDRDAAVLVVKGGETIGIITDADVAARV